MSVSHPGTLAPTFTVMSANKYMYHRAAIQFLTETGKMCSDIRQGESLSGDEEGSFVSICQLHTHLLGFFLPEFILLSDTLGLSSLIASLNNTKPPGATEATVLGPFFTEDAHDGLLSVFLEERSKRFFQCKWAAPLPRKAKGNI
jgi:hypothetical protein